MRGEEEEKEIQSLVRQFLQTDLRANAGRCREALKEATDRLILPILCRCLDVHTEPGTAGRPVQFRGEEAEGAEEVYLETFTAIFTKLDRLRTDPREPPIEHLGAYFVQAARHTCDTYLRRKYPQRTRLKDRLLYALEKRPEWAIWPGSRGGAPSQPPIQWCGPSAWRGRAWQPTRRYEAWQHDQSEFRQVALRHRQPSEMNLVELLLGLFRWIGTPLEVNELVTHLSKLYELEEPTIVPLTHSEEEGEEAGIVEEELPHPGETPEEEVVQRLHREEWLRQLWAEIQQLRDPQRQALLLGFDPEMIQVFKAVAGAEEIAAALGLVPEELARCLPSLPLSNAAIQERLGLTQAQDVSNLRKAARERLQRRMEKRQEFSEAW